MVMSASNLKWKAPMSKVYVVHHTNSKYNIVPAMEFGSLEPVLDGEIEPGPLNLRQVIAQIELRLAQFTEDDYLVLIGSPIAIAIASAVAALHTGGHFNILKWDQQERRYFSGVVNLYPKGR